MLIRPIQTFISLLWTGIQRSFASKTLDFCLEYGGILPSMLISKEVFRHSCWKKDWSTRPRRNPCIGHLKMRTWKILLNSPLQVVYPAGDIFMLFFADYARPAQVALLFVACL